MVADRITLADTNGRSRVYEVPQGATRASIDINDDTANFTWGTAVLDVQSSLFVEQDENGVDLTNWANLSPAVQFTSSTKRHRNISVSGLGNIRLATTTGDTGADPAAVVTVLFE